MMQSQDYRIDNKPKSNNPIKNIDNFDEEFNFYQKSPKRPNQQYQHHSRSQSQNSVPNTPDYFSKHHFNPISSTSPPPPTAPPPSSRSASSNWTTLIPPMPSFPPPTHQTSNESINNRSLAKPQRHSIAISPISSHNNSNNNLQNHDPISKPSTPQAPPTSLVPPYPQQRSHTTSNVHVPIKAPLNKQNSTPSVLPTQETNYASDLVPRKSVRKKKKICKTCGLEITGQFVRALSNAYHVNCFQCYQCDKQCANKFFPYEINDPTNPANKLKVALCEYDYFKKLDLICFNCDKALRGPYITALGNKYHLEHFRCDVCSKIFESDESYYEHDNNIYCHYHYSQKFAAHCDGCQSSIVKQFVELFRGGRNQQWHPECYMVHKFWNVFITADSVGLQTKLKQYNINFAELDILNLSKNSIDVDPKLLLQIEEQIENTVMSCWLILSGYEENSASCISDMLLYACTGNPSSGLLATGRFIVYVEILFNAIDFVQNYCQTISNDIPQVTSNDPNSRNNSVTSMENDSNGMFQQLKKEPRNISGKVMSYLAILRKSNQISASGSLSADLLSVITGCAHYLKLLIRIGLNNALKINKVKGTTEATDKFLSLTKMYENISGNDLNESLRIPAKATDSCSNCHKSIEKSCIKFGNKRWHLKCFSCSVCQATLASTTVNSLILKSLKKFKYDETNSSIICESCISNSTGKLSDKFEYISDLSQLIYLLKIALYRSKSVMLTDNGSPKIPSGPMVTNNGTVKSKQDIAEQRESQEKNYTKTINDVTKLRTRRQSQKLSNSIKQNARKSVIVEAPEGNQARKDVTNEDGLVDEINVSSDEITNKQIRKTSQASYIQNQKDDDFFRVKSQNNKSSLKIRDEPQRSASNNHLDRTSDLLKNEKSLTLDDIPRIVAAEQAREQRPNAFKHHNSLYQRAKPLQPVKTIAAANNNIKDTRNFSNSTVIGNVNNSAGVSNQLKKSKYYSELNKNEHFIIRHIAIEAILELCPNKFNRDELLGTIQLSKKLNGGFWDKFKFSNNSDLKNKAQAVFGFDLQDLTKKYGVDSDLGVGPSPLRIPLVVDDIINALRQKDMSVEGIFRLNGNIKKLRELTEQINKNPLQSPDFTTQTAVQLAALMKKWLRELPNPLLTFNLYELWISSQREKDPVIKKRILQLTYCMLPRSHRNLVEVLLYFFSWVASFAEIDEETGSKMDIHNLATVISPNILYSKQSGDSDQPPTSGETYFLGIEVVNQLIEIHEELSIIPFDLLQFFEKCNFNTTSNSSKNSDSLPSTKEIMSKIDKCLKENPKPFSDFDIKIENQENLQQPNNTIKRGHSKVLNESHGETTNI